MLVDDPGVLRGQRLICFEIDDSVLWLSGVGPFLLTWAWSTGLHGGVFPLFSISMFIFVFCMRAALYYSR